MQTAPGAASTTTIDRLVFRFAGTLVLLSLVLLSLVLLSLVMAQLHSRNWLWVTTFPGCFSKKN